MSYSPLIMIAIVGGVVITTGFIALYFERWEAARRNKDKQ